MRRPLPRTARPPSALLSKVKKPRTDLGLTRDQSARTIPELHDPPCTLFRVAAHVQIL